MSFNLSDFFIKDILSTAKNNIENKFLKLTINNVEYPILISRVRTALMVILICSRKDQVNDEKE